MKLTDYAVVRAFAEKAVENAKQQRNQQIKGDSSYSYRDDGGYMIYIQAGYRQKNGKTVYNTPEYAPQKESALFTQILFPNDPPNRLNYLKVWHISGDVLSAGEYHGDLLAVRPWYP